MNALRHEVLEKYENELRLFSMWMKNRGMTKASQHAYMSDAHRFLHTVYPSELKRIGKVEMMDYLSQSRERGAGDESRNRKLAAIRAFYKALMELEILQTNPAAMIAKSKQEKNRIPVYLEEDQLEVLFESIEGKYRTRNMAILCLMTYAGLRVGEIHRLNMQDLTQDGSIHVLGKGRKWRVIPLPDVLHALLRQSLEERLEPYKGKEEAFFVSQFGRRLSIRMVQTIAEDMFAKLKAKLPFLHAKKLSSHKLRHSFATMQIRSGTDIRTLQELLGHTSIETTQIYTHVDNKQLKHAMNNISGKIPVFLNGESTNGRTITLK
ncbi:tyrosine-type recombinase/integrase [Paenibacillus sp. MBLB4367]|uniref:tyrosine-type recombinase/integrase n=1 Tax=Paenibacillus sp. MBLB4367 TaxID=3384767 RepID=UPI003907EDC2